MPIILIMPMPPVCRNRTRSSAITASTAMFRNVVASHAIDIAYAATLRLPGTSPSTENNQPTSSPAATMVT
ncbi:MAG TPA: hypothetical protein VG299_06860 [Candidatus Dormibacteraeota bacterium]|nr:hypothetical protein [Candidatus Dormibacteraeota bacterium]